MKTAMLVSMMMGSWHFAHATWIYCKAYAASFLIHDAWLATLHNKDVNKPWSWADTWPVADIAIPSIDLKEIILSGDSGASLAFGPGLSLAGDDLDGNGVKLISGHRDTHFRKLQHININDVIFIKTAKGIRQYRVKDIGVVDGETYWIDNIDADYDLILTTCYPFDALSASGKQRFIVGTIEV